MRADPSARLTLSFCMTRKVQRSKVQERNPLVHRNNGAQPAHAACRSNRHPDRARRHRSRRSAPVRAAHLRHDGASRTAVREAIRILVGKGLLESKPKSGTRVRDPENWNHLDPDVLRWRLEVTDLDAYLKKLFQLRFAVEPTASALAAAAA